MKAFWVCECGAKSVIRCEGVAAVRHERMGTERQARQHDDVGGEKEYWIPVPLGCGGGFLLFFFVISRGQFYFDAVDQVHYESLPPHHIILAA